MCCPLQGAECQAQQAETFPQGAEGAQMRPEHFSDKSSLTPRKTTLAPSTSRKTSAPETGWSKEATSAFPGTPRAPPLPPGPCSGCLSFDTGKWDSGPFSSRTPQALPISSDYSAPHPALASVPALQCCPRRDACPVPTLLRLWLGGQLLVSDNTRLWAPALQFLILPLIVCSGPLGPSVPGSVPSGLSVPAGPPGS